MSRFSQLIPIVGTGASAAMIFNILPVFVGKGAETFGLSDSQAGWLATTYLAGFGTSSVSASLWLHRLGRRVLSNTLFLSAAALLAVGAMIESYVTTLGLLFTVGLALGGLYTMSFMLAAEYPDATRAVGIKLGGEVALGALLMSLIPALIYPALGFAGILMSLAIMLVAVLPCVRWLQTGVLQTGTESTHSSPMVAAPLARLALGALFLFTVGQAAVWSFVERASARAEFDASATGGGVLSVAVLFGGIASFLAGVLSDRLGKILPLLAAAALYLTAMALFALEGKFFWLYAGAVSLFFFAWLFALPYIVSAVADLDHSGQVTALVTACLAFGSMLGPAVGGKILEYGDFRLLYLSATVLTCTAYAIVVAIIRVQRVSGRSKQMSPSGGRRPGQRSGE